MVHIDGNAVRSAGCRSAAEGSFVTTIEGLSSDRSHPVQQAFIADMVVQCGYCIPGVIMAAAALIDRNDSPTDEQIDAAITNLCRCGIYPRLREAIRGRSGSRPGASRSRGRRRRMSRRPMRRAKSPLCGRSRAPGRPPQGLEFLSVSDVPVQQPLIRESAHTASRPGGRMAAGGARSDFDAQGIDGFHTGGDDDDADRGRSAARPPWRRRRR
jgi:isoquinoline 1-oxidoreductase alpha subunit